MCWKGKCFFVKLRARIIVLKAFSWYSTVNGDGILYVKNCDFLMFFNTIFVSSHMYPENPEGTQVIVGSMNMGYISDTARNRTHDLFRPKREPISLGHSAEMCILCISRET